MKNIPGPGVEGIRTPASVILPKWRCQVNPGFSDHHPWVAGLDKPLLYIPKYERTHFYFFKNIFEWLVL